MKRALYLGSLAFPLLVLIVAGLHLWKSGFTARVAVLAAWEVSISLYLALFMNRRSRNREAWFFYVSNGPGRDESEQLWIDGTAVAVSAAIFLTAFVLFLEW